MILLRTLRPHSLHRCSTSTSFAVLFWPYKVANTYGSLVCLKHECLKQIIGPSHEKVEIMRTTIQGTISFRVFFSTLTESILVQAHDPFRLALELETALEEQRFEDAWRAYGSHIHMDGFPRKSVLRKLITSFAQSCNKDLLNKAYNVVDLAFNKNAHNLLEKEVLIYLGFILSKSHFPVLASNIVRMMVKMEAFPSLPAWSAIIGHMCQTSTGAFLATDLLIEIGYLFKDNRVDPRKKISRPLLSMKPNTVAFNIALTGCLLFGTTKKSEELLILMPQLGVKPDSDLLIVMALIYEKNGHRDEIRNLQRHIDEAIGLSDLQFQQFYDCLLSCHLKFKDLDSATEMVLGMLMKAKEAKSSLKAAKLILEAGANGKSNIQNQQSGDLKFDSSECFKLIKRKTPTYIEFLKDRKFSMLESETKELLKLMSCKLHARVELVKSEHGILHPTEKMYAKLVSAFLDANRISDLACFLIKANNEDAPVSIESSAVVQVIKACVTLGFLEQAHDLVDEMRFSGIRVDSSVYSSLLKAYCEENRQAEISSLLKDAHKAGIQLDSTCYEVLIKYRVLQDDSIGALHLYKEMRDANISRSGHHKFDMLVEGCNEDGEVGLMAKLLEEIKDGQSVDNGVHDWNNVIHFFCKKRLMHDAHKALNKMRALGHTPNAQTFHSLVTAYAAIGGKYVEVTDLWGEMKVLATSNSIKFDQELLDSLLYCFVRGGFFLRAMEVIEMMEGRGMFIDKYKYRSLWLKYHRTLYKGKAPKIQTEAQLQRRDAALTFKKWIGLT